MDIAAPAFLDSSKPFLDAGGGAWRKLAFAIDPMWRMAEQTATIEFKTS